MDRDLAIEEVPYTIFQDDERWVNLGSVAKDMNKDTNKDMQEKKYANKTFSSL